MSVCVTRKEKRDGEDGKPRDEKNRVCLRVRDLGGLVCVPCSKCTEQALLVRGHLSYDRSVPTLPAFCLPTCLPAYLPTLPPSSTDCPLLLYPSTFTAAILPLAEPVGFSSFKVVTHLTRGPCYPCLPTTLNMNE